jgi:hypothetical protein
MQELTAGSQQRSKRCTETARVLKRAVAIREMTFYQLLIKISDENVLPSHIIKFRKIDCSQTFGSEQPVSWFSKNRASMTA